MATLLIDPDYLSQGNTSAWATSNPGQPNITLAFGSVAQQSATLTGTGLPSIPQFGYFEIRNAESANNNGLYQVDVVNGDTTSYDITKIAGSIGSLTIDASDTSAFILGGEGVPGNTTPGTSLDTAATGKSVYFDTFAKKVWLINQGNMTDEGANFQAVYSFAKEEWKNDPYLIQFDFPFTAITPEQFEIGSGTAAGWNFVNVATDTTTTYDGTTGRKTRELIRTGGWSEFDADGSTLLQQYAGIITLGTFDSNDDRAYYQQGNDPTDPAAPENFVFTGPVNEAVLTYDYITPADAITGFDIQSGADTVTRADGGSWVADGYQVGGRIVTIGATDSTNDGTYLITAIAAGTDSALTIDPTSGPGGDGFDTTNAADQTVSFAVDNRNILNVFLRANNNPSISKAYDKGTLSNIGVSTLSNQVYRFPLTNASDVVINNVDTAEGGGDWSDAFPFRGETKDNIIVQYFASPFKVRVNEDAQPPALQEFGIIVNNGSISGIDGAFTTGTSVFTSASLNPIPDRFQDGFLYITQTTANTYVDGQTGGQPWKISDITAGTITVDGYVGSPGQTFNVTGTNASFYLTPSTANAASFEVPASIQEIYASVQYQLREDSDIDALSTTVIGKTADELLTFVGTDAITAGSIGNPPTNPNGGGSGVYISNYLASDTNKITVVTNAGVTDNFPTVVTLTLNFNDNLTADQIAGGALDYSKFWLFYQYGKRRTGAFVIGTPTGFVATITLAAAFAKDAGTTQLEVNDYLKMSGFTNDGNNGIWRITANPLTDNSITAVKSDGLTPVAETAPGSANIDEGAIDTQNAIIVEAVGVAPGPITGDVNAGTITRSFAFTTNQQVSKPAATPTPVILRSIGLEQGQFVETTPQTLSSSDITVTATAGLERNYDNS